MPPLREEFPAWEQERPGHRAVAEGGLVGWMGGPGDQHQAAWRAHVGLGKPFKRLGELRQRIRQRGFEGLIHAGAS